MKRAQNHPEKTQTPKNAPLRTKTPRKARCVRAPRAMTAECSRRHRPGTAHWPLRRTHRDHRPGERRAGDGRAGDCRTLFRFTFSIFSSRRHVKTRCMSSQSYFLSRKSEWRLVPRVRLAPAAESSGSRTSTSLGSGSIAPQRAALGAQLARAHSRLRYGNPRSKFCSRSRSVSCLWARTSHAPHGMAARPPDAH